ncbi:MAG: protein kinase, partial [Planctomycetes bacterium]|nr:protein kinase [Planctomycetota bacterium]
VAAFDLFKLVEVIREVCQALHYAHTKGYLHRDLKPSNIFVGNYGEVYIIDWGLTKILKQDQDSDISSVGFSGGSPYRSDDDITVAEPGDSTITQSIINITDDDESVDENDTDSNTLTLEGDILGTPAYMSPEQAAGDIGLLGKQVDIYALGVMLYEVLTLKLPVEESDLEKMLGIKQRGEITPPEQRTPYRDIPPELSAITMQAMSPDPEERFKSVSQFNSAIGFWLEGKTQWHTSYRRTNELASVSILPHGSASAWSFQKDAITTHEAPARYANSYLLLPKEFTGDVRLSANFIAQPVENSQNNIISEFAIALNASVPKPWPGYLDCYSIHLGASGNTRAFLTKNDSEVASNEYIQLEPRRRYRLMVERTRQTIKVYLNRQVILYYDDSHALSGMAIGFRNMGPGVTISGIRIQTRGLPTVTSTIDVPEALMEEGCYEGALKRFLTIAQAHKNRREGAWARYRAGIASYNLDKNRAKAQKIWYQLRKTNFGMYENLGRAYIELESAPGSLKAARILEDILAQSESSPHLDPVADVVFNQVQQMLRDEPKGERGWKATDIWVRLALRFGQAVENKKSMMPSLLWRWILLALTKFPDHLPECTRFLSKTFGKGKGAFAEILTTIDPLIKILKRSMNMTDHAFLVDKVMRLILNHDDNLGNLETLARFYLHSGHENVTNTISKHIVHLCRKQRYDIPPMPISFIAFTAWIKGEKEEAKSLFKTMIRHSSEWARLDGYILLGLEHYFNHNDEGSKSCWLSAKHDPEASSFNRNLVAMGMLGELPPDPDKAGVPTRSDHRLLYCLFVGYKYYADWKRTGEKEARDTAVKLLSRVLMLLRPSYDIYSATDTFARAPLEDMGCKLHPKKKPMPISHEEENWIRELTKAASESAPILSRRTSSSHKQRN